MSLELSDLLDGLEARVTGPRSRLIGGLTLSSSQMPTNGLFIALVGSSRDGHRYVDDAVRRGAAAVVVCRPVAVPPHVTRIEVDDTRAVLPWLSARFYGDPSWHMTLVGITGTNGKTTTSYLLEAVFEAAGLMPGVIGTVNYRYGEQVLPAVNTTPDLLAFQGLLAQMREAGVDAVVAEVSSHALDQGRVDGLHFDAALFTNLTRDHLDYHRDLEAYFEAKARLFEVLLPESAKPAKVAVVNLDDPYGRRLMARARASEVWGFTCQGHPDADLWVLRSQIDLDGIVAEVASPVGRLELRSPLVGRHNLENLLGVLGVALGLHLPVVQVLEGLAGCRRVPGRLEEVFNPLGLKVFVDYAHSDDALRNLLTGLRPLIPGALITVFGCGGERDRGKRPLMALAASSLSELTVVTSDNPRGESPTAIVDEILPGLVPEATAWEPGEALMRGAKGYHVEIDRRTAIRIAIDAARPGDVVLIAGKGHEDYQLVGDQKLHFDDREEAAAALAIRTSRGGA